MSFLQTALTPSCAPARTIEKCTVEDAVDADFIILPMANYNAGDLETIVQTLERDHNATLFRRGMKDHIIPGLQNTRKSYQMAKELSTRSHELANPMVKFVVDIWCVVRSSVLFHSRTAEELHARFRGWWYHFSSYHSYTTQEQIFMYYDRIMSVVRSVAILSRTSLKSKLTSIHLGLDVSLMRRVSSTSLVMLFQNGHT